MAQKTIQLKLDKGLHARPVTQIIKYLENFTCDVNINYNGKSANAKSMLALLTLGIKPNSEIEIVTQGEAAEALLDKFIAFLENELVA